jgi:D-alanyl-D-alanine carboxypeptidase
MLLPVLLLAGLVAGCSAPDGASSTATSTATPSLADAAATGRTKAPKPSRQGPPPFDKKAHSTSDPTSIWVVVNKTHPIAASYRPEISLVRGYQVAVPAARPLGRLLDDGDAAGLGFKIASAFRSYEYQRSVHDATVVSDGEAEADRISARPGYSEHQTGLAVDLVTPDDPGCDFEACFGRRPGGRWIAANAWRYGFIVRYTAGNEQVTGYAPEPWHLRYVGRPLAAAMHRAHVTTLEKFLGVAGGDYR